MTALYTKTASKTTSNRYKHIDSEKILEIFTGQGFGLDNYSEAGTRKLENVGYQRHLLQFSREDLLTGDGEKLQLLVTNSHDGRSSLCFDVGIFRFACANGLVVGNTAFSSRVRHTGDVDSSIDMTIKDLLERIPLVAESIVRLKEKQIDDATRGYLAYEAAKLRLAEDRFGDVFLPNPIRLEDRGTDLWTFYNVLQESLIRGGLKYTKPNGDLSKLRKVSSIRTNTEVNKGLWNLVLDFAEGVAA